MVHLSIAHGASVLLLSSPLNPHLPNLELDTARGKRAAYLDLDKVKLHPDSYDPDTYAPKIESYPGREQFKDLVKNGDVVLQAYRRKSPSFLERSALLLMSSHVTKKMRMYPKTEA